MKWLLNAFQRNVVLAWYEPYDTIPVEINVRSKADGMASLMHAVVVCVCPSVWRLNLSYLYLALPLGVIPLEFRRDFWHSKIRVPGLS